MPKLNLDMKKLMTWLAILPLAIVVGTIAFSPKSPVAPTATAQASQPAAPAATPSAPVLKPTALPVMYEFFTGW